MNNGKISVRQFTILVSLFTIGSGVLIAPSGMAALAKQNAWIAAVIGTAVSLLLVALYNVVGNQFPTLTLAQLNEKLFGKWVGKAVMLLLLATIFVGGLVGALFSLGNFMVTQMLTITPIQSIHILFMVIVVAGVRLGLEPLARSAEILFPWVIFFFLCLIVFAIPQAEPEKLQPVLEDGWKPLAPAVLSMISLTALPNIILLMIFPSSVKNPREARKAFYIGTLIGGIIMIAILMMTVLVLGWGQTARSMYPSYVLAQKIDIADFFQRLEAIMSFLWFITLFFRLALYFYVIVVGVAQIFRVQNYRPLTLPLGMIAVVLSQIIYPNVTYEMTWDMKTWVPYTIVIGLFYPLLLLGAAAVRRYVRKGAKSNPGR